jgi:hypothetical protein
MQIAKFIWYHALPLRRNTCQDSHNQKALADSFLHASMEKGYLMLKAEESFIIETLPFDPVE